MHTKHKPLLFLSLLVFLCTGCADNFSNNFPNPSIDSPIASNHQNSSVKHPSNTKGNKTGVTLAKKTENNLLIDGKTNELSPTLFDENSTCNPSESEPELDEALEYCQASQDFWQQGELEKALESLDHAYALILNVDSGENAKALQQKEDLRFMISKRILEIYASRNIVVNGNHNAIPITMNSHVENEIKLFTTGAERNFFIESYKRSGKYRPFIVSKLKEAGLPEELSWLPLIESGFKTKALSKARALGLWQFIPSTGYKFGLQRSTYIDDRMDFEKSTDAAIAYLKELHQIFGDWATVLASYNCGEGRVLRTIRSQNVNYLDNFWDLYLRLPFETARYVPRFLATLHIVNHPEEYGLDEIDVDPPLEYEKIDISKQVRLEDIAKATDLSKKLVCDLNPELRYNITPPDLYSIKLPSEKGSVLLSRLDQIETAKLKQTDFVYYKVKKGDTLSTIARRYRTTSDQIRQANNLRKNTIVAGKLLKIPTRTSYIAKTATTVQPSGKNSSRKSESHTVKNGESLWTVAKKYNVTVEQLKKLNHLSSTDLKVGQKLTLPSSQSQQLAQNSLKAYRVKEGDTPFKIAQEYDIPLEKFMQINKLIPRHKIYPGQTLYVY